MKGLSNVPCMLVIIAMIQRFGSANVLKTVDKLKKDITNEVAAIKTPILDVVVPIIGSQCSHVKKIIGVDYERLNRSEPDVSKLNVQYITKDYQYIYYLPELAANLPKMPDFDENSPIYLYIHGFTDNPSKTNFQLINNAFQSLGEKNILALDSSSLIGFWYLHSSSIVRLIGHIVGKAFANLVKVTNFDPAKIHFIGHSLGAHISGYAGKTFYEHTGLKFGRITGLDPAGPCFGEVIDTLKLKKTDADFVDVIHTDAGVYGINQDLGHADFYVNGGSRQPGCVWETCSHHMANEYFAESMMQPDAFQAVNCPSHIKFQKGHCQNNTISNMGFGATPGITGRFFLQTNELKPFGAYEEGLHYKNRDGIVGAVQKGVRDLLE